MTAEGSRSLQDVTYEKNRRFTTLMAYSAGDLIYVGRARAGTATSDGNWQICKLTWVGGAVTALKWASGVTTFSKVWDDRATYTYS